MDVIEITKDEWIKKGESLFGKDFMEWRFVCPSCGHVQAVKDFKKYKDHGVTPDTATYNCIGRYDGHIHVNLWTKPGPCNYTSGGLFNLCPVVVIIDDDSNESGKRIPCFAFDEGEK